MSESSIARIVEEVKSNFRGNILSVKELMSFDNILLEHAITSVTKASEDIKKAQGVTNTRFTLEGLLKSLQNIRQNDSLKPKYEKIFNSCLVLVVSYFSSALEELFLGGLKHLFASGRELSFGKEELKFSIFELQQRGFDLRHGIEDAILAREDMSWQDMKSVGRVFRKYFEFEIQPDVEILGNIVLAQACRHVIVHSDGRVGQRTLRQVSGYPKRTVKPSLTLNEPLQFTPTEIDSVAASMNQYLAKVSADLEDAIG